MNTMIKMTVEVTTEQASAIIAILSAQSAVPETAVVSAPSTPLPTVPFAAPIQTIPAPAPVPVQQPIPTAPPVQSAPSPQAPVPVTQRTYTQDELALASRPICEAGRQAELINLLHSFTYTDANGAVQQVQSIQQLPPDKYADFANGIRALGGKI